jgi:chorismate dehydratase
MPVQSQGVVAERGLQTPSAAPLRVGVVSYLNAVPLVHGLAGEPRFELQRELPARVAEQLHQGALDVGLIPSIEYAAGDYAIVPGIAIACRAAVRSVCLFHERPLEQVRRVALDTSSRTSVALTRILLAERLAHTPEYLPMAPDLDAMLGCADAALVIGDRALEYEQRPHLDLGATWVERTGLPFVFAFWAGPRGRMTGADVLRLQAAKRAGLAAIDELAVAFGGDAHRNATYLRDNIVFDLGAEELAGLREFLRRAHALGLIGRLPELTFHEPA